MLGYSNVSRTQFLQADVILNWYDVWDAIHLAVLEARGQRMWWTT